MSSLWERLRVRWTVLRSRPAPGLRTAKATFAVVAAYLLTAALGVSDHPMVAPLVALRVVQLTLHNVFTPTDHEIQWAQSVLAGFEAAGGGGFALPGGEFVDRPAADRPRRVLEIAG